MLMRLKGLEQDHVLYAHCFEDEIQIVATIALSFINAEGSIQECLPAGLQPIGFFIVSSTPETVNLDQLLIKYHFLDISIQAVLIFKQNEEIKAYEQDNPLTEIDVGISSNKLLLLHVGGRLGVYFSSDPNDVEKSFSYLCQKVESTFAAFRLEEASIIVISNSEGENVLGGQAETVEDLVKLAVSNEDQSGRRKGGSKEVATNFELLWISSGPVCTSRTMTCSPSIYYKTRTANITGGMLTIDSLVLTSKKYQTDELFYLLTDAVVKQLNQTKRYIIEKLKTDGSIKMLPKRFHFKPRALRHFVSVTATEGEPEEGREPRRKELHLAFGLPMNEPYFRLGCQYQLPDPKIRLQYLMNVHEHGAAGLIGGQVSLVQGNYAYHHYMQDKFDDNGWGCAYRSLQTIVSWYRHQGYTTQPVPSHKDIQKCLCDIGDKSASFVGSRQWIGSLEVSYILKSLLGVDSVILSVSSGTEMDTIVRKLADHFNKVGTPVMIGGGVLAHTILGVEYEPSSGRCAFLILDPHYTGAEDINTIIARGWCGWKTIDFWDKSAFYNLCLPQRPELF